MHSNVIAPAPLRPSVGLRTVTMPDYADKAGFEDDLDPEIAEALRVVRAEAAAGRSQKAHVEVVGVYPVKAAEPCHLVELWVRGVNRPFDFGDFQQEAVGQPEALWQCAWLEHILSADGARVLAAPEEVFVKREFFRANVRVAFFMHYLDLCRPLITPFGRVKLPQQSRMPRRLAVVHYEQPD